MSYQFDPGGATPAWGTYVVKGKGEAKWRVGFRINVKCTGTGQSTLCEVWQTEKGALTFTVDNQKGQIIGEAKNVKKFHKFKLGDKWEKEYSDALGGDYPNNTTSKMTVELNMDFELKCLSSDGTAVSTKFRITGTVEAQAVTKGGRPALTNPQIAFTPIQP